MNSFLDFGIDVQGRARGNDGRFESEARAAALAAGNKRYRSLRPCPAGHVGERFTSNCGCVECLRESAKRYHHAHRDANLKRLREYAKRDPLANRERSSAARYGGTRIVPWSERKEIQEFFRRCPDGLEVDHVIPLAGKTVSGLHVLANLQYVTKRQNAAKGNRHE
jgi:hypothetical protein